MKTKTLITTAVSLILIATGCDQPNNKEKNSSNNHATEIETEKRSNDIEFSEVIENQSISLKRIQAAKTEYYGKELEIYGYLEVDDYYNCKYRDSENTHYSFKLKDNNYNDLNTYFKKSISKDLFNKLIDVDKLPVKLKVIALKRKQGSVCDLMVEGLEYEIIGDNYDLSNEIKNERRPEEASSQKDISELIEGQTISLKRIQAAKTEYYGKELEIYGYLEVDDYYNCKYRDSENTHYSFKLKDNNYNDLNTYFKKSISKDLFNKLIDVDKLPVKLKVIALKRRQGSVCDLMVEGLEYEIIEN